MAVTPIPGPNAYASIGLSPRIQRFGVWRRSVTVKDIPVAAHAALTGTPVITGLTLGVLAAGTVMSQGSDGYWYAYGVTLPGGVNQAFLSLTAGGVPPLCLLVDPIDTTINTGTNPVMGAGYFSGDFILSFLQFAGATTFSTAVASFLRLNDIFVEGTVQVMPGTYPGTSPGYGPDVPREDGI